MAILNDQVRALAKEVGLVKDEHITALGPTTLHIIKELRMMYMRRQIAQRKKHG